MKDLKIGYLSLVKGSWINETLEAKRQNALKALKGLDVKIEDCGLLLQNESEARAVCQNFADKKIDALLVHFITFSLGSIVPSLAKKLGVPVILWSEPEPEMKGGRIESNSFCASNMNAHALKKLKVPYGFIYGKPEKVTPELVKNLKALSAVKFLKNLRVGSFGGRVPGFYTSNFNELKTWEKFGTEIENITLLELVKLAESMDEKDFSKYLETVKGKCDAKDVSEEELNKAAALYAAFLKLAEKYKLDAVAVRCWPEFGDIYGIAVCHVLSCLTENGLTAACEGDVYGAIAMALAQKLTGSKAFFCDLISFDDDGDTGIFWHCGAAPVSLCGQNNCPALKKHSIVDGGSKKGITCEFPLKEGPVTVLRIGEDENGAFRLLTISAQALPTEQILKGNPVKVRFKRTAKEMAETLIEKGVEHHFALIHGDIKKEFEFFTRWLNLELIQL